MPISDKDFFSLSSADGVHRAISLAQEAGVPLSQSSDPKPKAPLEER